MDFGVAGIRLPSLPQRRLALAPLLLQRLLILLVKTVISGLIEYRRSGRWPVTRPSSHA